MPPVAFVLRSEDVTDEIARLVDVALVVVPLVTVRDEMVEDAATMTPRVDVGARYPPVISHDLPKIEPGVA
jgi:hypothetical protein